ncbi:hypothetical protein [Vibrio rotiferianus]|uniref:hypothetical protein n=1 Tax=Vibrio rotiferianus TaxID=190895 RepID=UPI0005EFC051|nr:hypothetical protein [Vibrio rotiferianus]
MSLPPIGHSYKCNSCGHEFIKHYPVFSIVPCEVNCVLCRKAKAADLVFDTIKEKHKAQRASVRRAGLCISDAAEEMKKSVSVKDCALGKKVVIEEAQFQMALDKLARAGESLSNLPK